MKCLFLDIASQEKSVALVTETAAHVSAFPALTDEASLLPFLQTFVEKHGATFQSLTRLATVTGPGGFMSLRTGIALMNALQWQLKVTMAGIHLSDLWNARAGSGERVAGSSFLWLHSTKKDAFFVRGFGSYEKTWKEPTLISLADLQSALTTPTPYVGEVLEEQAAQLPRLEPYTSAKSLEQVLPAFLATLTYTSSSQMPWYGRGA